MKKEDKKSSEYISEFLNFTRDLQALFDFHYGAVNDCDCACGDLKHQIELGPYKDRNKAATAFKKVLQKRRIHKDFVDVNSELVKYFKDPEFIKVYRRLEQLLGAVRKQEKYVEGQRVYRPRRTVSTLTIKTTEEE